MRASLTRTHVDKRRSLALEVGWLNLVCSTWMLLVMTPKRFWGIGVHR